jgi:hypothetical protein
LPLSGKKTSVTLGVDPDDRLAVTVSLDQVGVVLDVTELQVTP